MIPLAYKKNKDSVIFRYETSELKEWLRLGRLEGNVGAILIHIDYTRNIKTFAVFGTIDKPNTVRTTWHMRHFDLFDGNIPTPEQIINPVLDRYPFKDFRFFIPHD